jgi:Domain of unknown function (DUF2935)
MKEHLFFIETNLQPVETAHIVEASVLKQAFEQLLAETVFYANGIISEDAVKSNEFVTPYTYRAEVVTSTLTGASINTGITKAEFDLVGLPSSHYRESLENIVQDLNRRSINLLEKVIAFKKKLLGLVLECKIFISLYPEMLEHDTREALYYLELLKCLQQGELPNKTLCDELNFWNNIMGEHAQFVDGMLDPTEKNLKKAAAATAKKFEDLVRECVKTAEEKIYRDSLEYTKGIRDFKKASVEGLLGCKIKSIIPPLLADHVLREANYYLRLLR